MASLQQYIIDVKSAISNEDSIKLKDLISIRPQGEEGIKRSQFDIPSSADVSVLPERFQSVVTSYIQLLKLVYIQSDIKAAFKDLNTLTTNLASPFLRFLVEKLGSRSRVPFIAF